MSTTCTELSILFVGLGSIGQRHLGNLDALCRERGILLRVSALRATSRALPPQAAALVQHSFTQLPKNERYDIIFVTNPTHLHAETMQSLDGRAEAFFIEKPIFDRPCENLSGTGLPPEQKAYVAAPMRWTALFTALKGALAQSGHTVFSARAICSSYLPEWRKNVDYRENYSAHREQGGGVILDLIHEWDYLVELFGLPQESRAFSGHYSNLEIDSDDLSVYIARYPDMLCELHLDYFGREYRRRLELFCPDGTLTADFGTGLLTLPGGDTRDYSEPPNRRYEREMAYFLDYALAGDGESLNSPQRAQAVLKLALGV